MKSFILIVVNSILIAFVHYSILLPILYFLLKTKSIITYSARRHKADCQHINAKVCQNAHDRPIVYNLLGSYKTKFV